MMLYGHALPRGSVLDAAVMAAVRLLLGQRGRLTRRALTGLTVIRHGGLVWGLVGGWRGSALDLGLAGGAGAAPGSGGGRLVGVGLKGGGREVRSQSLVMFL